MTMTLDMITKGAIERPPRILLCGVEKIGKSTFAAGAPSPIFLPIAGEEGIDALDVARFPTIATYDEMTEALGVLAEQDHGYKTVVIDSTSAIEPLVFAKTCEEAGVNSIEKVGGGFGKGYIEALNYWRDITNALDYLRETRGMGCILIGHVTVRTFSDPTSESYDQYELDIHKKAAAALMRWSDAILFANAKVYTKEVDVGAKKAKRGALRDERVLFTQKRPAHPGGGRGVFGQLPYELPLNYEAWSEAIKAKKEEKKV